MATYDIGTQIKACTLVDPAELTNFAEMGRYIDYDAETGAFMVEGAKFSDQIVARARDLQYQRQTAQPKTATRSASLATERQLSYIRSLIARRRRDGEGSGFMAIPSEAELTTLTRRDASALIDSLRDSY